jgi:transcriptional regulator with XRE-family HTH domain
MFNIQPDPERKIPINRIAEVMREKNVSVQALAKKLGCTRDTVRQYKDECKDILVSELRIIANALDVPITELIIDPDPQTSLKNASIMRLFTTVREMNEAIAHEQLEDEIEQNETYLEFPGNNGKNVKNGKKNKTNEKKPAELEPDQNTIQDQRYVHNVGMLTNQIVETFPDRSYLVKDYLRKDRNT